MTTKISDLRPGVTATIKVDVVKVEAAREITTKFGKQVRVCNAIVKDETGEIKLTLWNEQIEAIQGHPKLEIRNGWVSEFKGELQITAGKKGEIVF